MDCANFDNLVIDALYDELDADASTGMDEHAAGCEACASRIDRLRKTQELTRSALESPFPAGLEDRILAAAEAAMMVAPSPSSAESKSNVINLADRRPTPPQPRKEDASASAPSEKKSGGVVAFLARPQFAIAASFILLLGGLAAFLKVSAKSESAASSSMAPSPVGAAASVAPGGGGGAAAADDEDGVRATAVAATATPTAAASQLALNDPAPAPMPGNWKGHAGPSGGAAGKETKEEAEKKADKDSFAFNRGLAEAGNCKEALPKLEAIAKTNPQAELSVARCLEQTQNCAAAIPRFDSAARRNAGTETGSRAALEAANCYNRENQTAAARGRYSTLKNDAHVGNEANNKLDELDRKAGPEIHASKTPKAAPPPATATAVPSATATTKATKPADVDPSINNSRR
jgi:hypothetical protein